MIRHPRQSGFTLIELMIAVAIALIITASAAALMASIMQANGQNIASTRLNQELRTVAEIMLRDLKRARYSDNTIFFVGEMNDDDDGDGYVDNCGDPTPPVGSDPTTCDWQPNDPQTVANFLRYEAVTVPPDTAANDGVPAVDTNGDGKIDTGTVDGICIQYGYQDANPAVTPFHSISRQPDPDGIGAVWMTQAAASPAACGSSNAASRLSSKEVNITGLAFNYAPSEDWVRITVSGSLVNDPSIVRRFTTSLRFRSQPVPL